MKSPVPAILEESPPPASVVREALGEIIESQPFRTSKQCQDLLRHIVDRSLSGDDASLRERVIGVEVFGRKPTYDTAQDPVVRVRAADVRKRLAQYYQSMEPGKSTLQIELPSGSYKAHFRRFRLEPVGQDDDVKTTVEPYVREIPPPAVELKARRFSLRTGIVAMLVIAFIGGLAWWFSSFWKSPQERFWAPLVATKQPVLFYLGSNAAYVFTPDYLARYRTEHHLANNGPEFFVDLPPDSSIAAKDLAPVPDTFVTMGDLAASVQLTSLMADWKKAFVVRSGRDLSFGDLRNRPSVLIGGFNNPWTLELTMNLPYSLQQGTRIQSRDHPDRMWVMTPRNDKGTTDDYALISRLLVSGTGGPLLTVAGIGEYGTQAAAEFVSSPEKMHDLLKSAPRGWESKNMQAVLHIQVVGFTPVAVEVIATTYW